HRWKGYEQKLVAVDPKQRFNTSTDCLRKRLVLHHFGLVAAGRVNSIAIADTHFSAVHSALSHNPLRGELNPASPRRGRDRAIEEIHSRACHGPAPEERGGITPRHTAVRTEIAHRVGRRCFTRRRYTILQKFRVDGIPFLEIDGTGDGFSVEFKAQTALHFWGSGPLF